MAERKVYVVGKMQTGKKTLLSLIYNSALKDPRFEVKIIKGADVLNRILISLRSGRWHEREDSRIALQMMYKKGLRKTKYRFETLDIDDSTRKDLVGRVLDADCLFLTIDTSVEDESSSTYFATLLDTIKSVVGRKLKTVAVLTKCDVSGVDMPKEWLREHYPLLVDECSEVFAVRIYTENSIPAKPLMVDGIASILNWLVENLR